MSTFSEETVEAMELSEEKGGALEGPGVAPETAAAEPDGPAVAPEGAATGGVIGKP
eukprot:CAMPEP_0195581208 /NCGR_PEP_ID=MMETSP0814-20130614/19736_1 /TAXON_ID=97485 /ORGANISM="Prymnesium parvum, Strain Texoma1" /LENGTH=55 /DNA_ID=CAMNT_0040718517 /DNA_START=11 /DNA_END=174 /DNA_ORIENTATION=-